MSQYGSAIKAHKQSLKKSLRNKSVKTQIKTWTKKLERHLYDKDLAKSRIALVSTQSAIMRAVTKRVLKLNTASRKVSQLTHKVKFLENALSDSSSR